MVEQHDVIAFDAISGGYDRLDISGVEGRRLRDDWADSPNTYLGLMTHGFPNLLMVAGPQSVSGSTNFPRAIEKGVEFVTGLLTHARDAALTRIEAESDAQEGWVEEVRGFYDGLLLREAKGWFTGYNSNVAGHQAGTMRLQAYFGGAPRYAKRLDAVAAAGYEGFAMT